MSHTTCDLSIIIVSWNVADLLRDCLHSIVAGRGELELQVIVVDSASSDNSVAMVRDEFPWVELLACDENVGFPKGNNLGLARANGRYVLLLNPDTVILGDALPQMMSFMRQNSGVGVLGCQLLNADGTVQSSKRRFPTLATAFFESTWLEFAAPKGVLKRYYAEDLPDDATNDVDWVVGACMLLPTQVVAAVGGMDEAYFMYSEELDWCRRIKDSGWRVVYYPEAKIIHLVGQSSDQAVVARHINFQQAKLRYFRKFNGRLPASLLRLFLLLNYVWQLSLEGLKGILGHKRPLRRQRVQAYWQVIRSGLRPAGY
ncbi:MAG: glycosyl transferase [Chloroflexi bacterium]|nr:MAG: glycosyl transferase [Chloroflexota bacterium]